MIITWDTETNGLLNDTTINYNSIPYKLKDTFKLHCVVVEDHIKGDIYAFYDGDHILLDGRVYKGDGVYTTTLENYTPINYIKKSLCDFKQFIIDNVTKAVAHNGINFDHLVVKMLYEMDYTVEKDTWCGKDIDIEDTLVTSKTLNPDRFGGHSLDNLGKIVGLKKIEFRKEIPEDIRYEKFDADMLYYCIRDVQVNTKVYKFLEKEKAGWDWQDAISLEKAIAEIVTRQEHRGFHFNKKLAEECIPELDQLLMDARSKVEPHLPMKTPTAGFQKDVTPPVRQFLNNGKISSYLTKYIEKHNGELLKVGDSGLDCNDFKLKMFDKIYDLPLKVEPMITSVKCTLEDTTEIKEWLVGMGWIPSEWNERDLTMYADKRKGKLPAEKFKDAVKNYVDKTLKSPLRDERCDHLKVKPKNLEYKLMNLKDGRGQKVLTNPKFTKGQEKEICPNLEKLSSSFPYARDIVDYLTYKHRRNSILGGGVEWEDNEDAEKGYLAHVRSDGRIPTPADTCGASTSRMTHKIVANIPRVTSLYGDKMRALFETDSNFWQIGYDFDSLEAKIEADGVYKYKGGKEYGYSLTAEKPNDCHSVLARQLSDILGYEFSRGSAKPVKYGCSYNAQPARVAKTIGCDLKTGQIVFDVFWEQAAPLKALKERMIKYWETTGQKKFLLGLDGRKLPIRSKGNVINTRFQSSGVICAKRAAVIHDRKLKEEGYYVDLFKEDLEGRKCCNQLIMYHDEAQLEVTKQDVVFKIFDTKEAAQEYKDLEEDETGKIWSDIGHTKKGYYVAYCRAGELATEAAREAGEYYNLNVELTAGYMVGNSWASCH